MKKEGLLCAVVIIKKDLPIGAPSVRKVPQGLLYLKLNNSFVETV